MRRLGNLFPEVISAQNLWHAWRDFRRGKRSRPAVRAFEPEVDCHLAKLRRELTTGDYRSGGYRLVELHEPKRRLIAAAPVRDRIVHHAVHRVLAPRLDRSFIDTTYACLPGRGSHRAILALVAALRRHRFVLALDIRRYFLSIDREILLGLFERRLKDQELLGLLRVIADSGEGLYRQSGVPERLGLEPGFPPAQCGLPIGNLTSQWWGNHYLNGLDHFVKRQIKAPHYQRYMDDCTLLADSRERLEEAREAIKEWLWQERRLELKAAYATPGSTDRGLTYLGYRVSRHGVAVTRRALRRMQQKLGQAVLGPGVDLARSVGSYKGLVLFPGTARRVTGPLQVGQKM